MSREPRPGKVIVHYLDVVAVIVLAGPALAAGAPVLGYLVGAAGWIGQRALQVADRYLIDRRLAPRLQLRFSLFERFGRIWLMAGAIVIAGVAGKRADGLTAALVIFAAYTIAFVLRLASGPPPPRSGQ